MTTLRNYSRSPITEAIIAFQVELPAGVELSDLVRCQETAYPLKKSLPTAVGPIEPGKAVSRLDLLRQAGLQFASADEKLHFEVRLDGFAIHRLAPYEGWAPFRDEARRLWNRYRETVRAQQVTRVAVRYINRLDLPLPAELKDFLRTAPEVSPDLPQQLNGFFMELNLPLRDIESTLVLREMVVPPAAPNVASVILDIDLFRSEAVPADDGAIWAFIDSLRVRKNEIFEACITDRTREVLQ